MVPNFVGRAGVEVFRAGETQQRIDSSVIDEALP